MKTIKTGTVSSKIKRGDQVVFIAGKEYARYDSAGKRQPFRGKVIAVDARNGSPTYGRHFSIELSAANKRQLLIPKGFAHGFSVLSERAEVLYKCDGFYNKESEGGFRFDDPAFNIDWQIPADKATISDKDKILPFLESIKTNFEY